MQDAPRLEEVLREHGPMLSRVVSSYARDAARRDDLLQEISIALWQALPKWRGEAPLRGFVMRVAHNRIIDTLARERRWAGAALDEAWPDPAADPLRHAEEGQRTQGLVAAVHALPLALRQAVVLALEGFSQREIAQALGLEENAVAQRLSRARRQLRGWMGNAA